MKERSTRSIDLNADLGEHDGEGYAHDAELLGIVSSASVACGAHAGSTEVMERTAGAAARKGVSIGAHPSYPDRKGFGRRELQIGIDSTVASMLEQIAGLIECCSRAGARVRYVKPHGALYNRAAHDAELAAAIAQSIAKLDSDLVILTLPESALEMAAESAGMRVAREAFIDRAYTREGRLVPRSREGAVLHDPEVAARRALRIARDNVVETVDGHELAVEAQSLCVHGDSPGALEIVRLARRTLEDGGFMVRAFA